MIIAGFFFQLLLHVWIAVEQKAAVGELLTVCYVYIGGATTKITNNIYFFCS